MCACFLADSFHLIGRRAAWLPQTGRAVDGARILSGRGRTHAVRLPFRACKASPSLTYLRRSLLRCRLVCGGIASCGVSLGGPLGDPLGGRPGRASPSGSACGHRCHAGARLVLAGCALRVPVAPASGGPSRSTTAAGKLRAALDSSPLWGAGGSRQIRDQDPTVDPGGVVRIRQGVARDRRISIEAGQMRHGRKTRSRRIDGYKRHVLPRPRLRAGPLGRPDPANLPEAQVAGQIQSTWTPRAWAWRAAR
jgi:hypothetical protein